MAGAVPRLQGDVVTMGTKIGEVQRKVVAMGAKIDGIHGSLARLEELLLRQARVQPSPPRRPREDLTPPRWEPRGPIWGEQSTPRGREGYRDGRSPERPRGRREHRGGKLELPLFHGDEPQGLIFRAERYFAVNDDEGRIVGGRREALNVSREDRRGIDLHRENPCRGAVFGPEGERRPGEEAIEVESSEKRGCGPLILDRLGPNGDQRRRGGEAARGAPVAVEGTSTNVGLFGLDSLSSENSNLEATSTNVLVRPGISRLRGLDPDLVGSRGFGVGTVLLSWAGPNSGVMRAGPQSFSEIGVNFSTLCPGFSSIGSIGIGRSNSSTFLVGYGKIDDSMIDFFRVGVGDFTNAGLRIGRVVSPNMVAGFVASAGNLRSMVSKLGRRWSHSTSVT